MAVAKVRNSRNLQQWKTSTAELCHYMATTPTATTAPRPPSTARTKLSQMIEADSIFADIDIGITDLVSMSENISNLLGPSNTIIKREVRMMTQTLNSLHLKMEEAMRKVSKLRSHKDLISSKKAAISNKINLEKAVATSSNKRKSPPLHTIRIQEIFQSNTP